MNCLLLQGIVTISSLDDIEQTLKLNVRVRDGKRAASMFSLLPPRVTEQEDASRMNCRFDV